MSQNVAYHTLKITFTDVTSELDATYGVEYLAEVYARCLGQWVTVWGTGGAEAQYTNWVGGIIMGESFGVDPHTNWFVSVSPIGNPHCHLKGDHAHCSVGAAGILRQFNWQDTTAVVNIPWNVIATA